MGADVIGQPVVQLLLCGGQSLLGVGGHQQSIIEQYICTPNLACLQEGCAADAIKGHPSAPQAVLAAHEVGFRPDQKSDWRHPPSRPD